MSATCARDLPIIIHLSFGKKVNRQELTSVLERKTKTPGEGEEACALIVWAEDFLEDWRRIDEIKAICERGLRLIVIYTYPFQEDLMQKKPQLYRTLPGHIGFDTIMEPPEAIITLIETLCPTEVAA